ncbi:palmitoyltransferase ZDHHC23 [Thrips palmi]|uniref:Palmitoyltransferase n=1 Tax=Thrips palmi TaxID=161013 RepID=A0A6P9ADR0_THRPL|nr:palmitoyltransferase ZDHHC23 [Thrips palmi]XP_034255497.1 palmitoyltransferase ZDHHC23 [Thrips palmi]
MVNSSRVPNALCCCEYIDKDGRRNHILACCCNCVELDKAFDSFCCCRRGGHPGCDRVILAMLDRMRVPWLGGAKLISCDILLPMLLLPSLFAFGAINFPCTVVAFLSMLLLVLQLHRTYFRSIPNSKFFCTWTYTSFALIFLIYEFLVVPFLEITIQENLIFIVVSIMSILSLYKVQTLRNSQASFLNDVEKGDSSLLNSKASNTCSVCTTYMTPRMVHCSTCQKCVPKRELHCLWFGCCIGSHNLFWFIICLVSLSVSLLYSSNLILTTVCRPYQVVGSLLLPEDCSEVYYEFRFALCFVSGLYSLMMSVLSVFALLRQCWLVSLGITGNEWRTMPLSHLLRFGITAHRPYSHGLLKNWYYVLTRQNVYSK